MAIPAMVSIIIMIIYNMADMFFVGQLGDMSQVAAVSLVGPVFTLMMAIGTMIGGGGSVLIAKTLGEKDFKKVKLYSSLCCWSSIVLGLLFSAVVLLLSNPLLWFLGANSDTFHLAKQYMAILALGAPITTFANGYGNVIRGEGAVKEGMVGHLPGTLVNIVLDPLFILVLRMGVGGAAVATVLGNVAAALYFLVYIKKSNTNLTLHPSYAKKQPSAIIQVLARVELFAGIRKCPACHHCLHSASGYLPDSTALCNERPVRGDRKYYRTHHRRYHGCSSCNCTGSSTVWKVKTFLRGRVILYGFEPFSHLRNYRCRVDHRK